MEKVKTEKTLKYSNNDKYRDSLILEMEGFPLEVRQQT
jgi:hypothetical protein